MNSPTLSQMATRQEIQTNREDSTCANLIRICLLTWAFLRLAVSLLWAGILTLATFVQLVSLHAQEPPSELFFGAIMIELVEFEMLVIFIVAGFKKSVRFYLIYYRYCILTLIINIIWVTICLSLDHNNGHHYGDVYLFFNFYNLVDLIEDKYILLVIVSIFNVGLEILLIFLIKKLINNYTPGENVNNSN